MANLPSGTWEVFQWDIQNKKDVVSQTDVSGNYTFATSFSRTVLTFFRKVSGRISAPVAPSSLQVLVVNETTLKLQWQDNSLNEDGFKIERKIGSTETWNQIQTVSPNTVTYQDTNLIPGTTYYYRVRSYNSGGDSAYSDETYATTPQSAIPVITEPSSNIDFYPLQSVTAKGTGKNLSWSIQWITSFSITTLKTGTGTAIAFTVSSKCYK